jgi:hypothetical protein
MGPWNCHWWRSPWGGMALHPGGRAHQVQDPWGVRDRAGGGHTSSMHCDPRGMMGGVRRDVNIARGTTVQLVIRKRQTGKTVFGWDVPRVLHCCRRLRGRHVRAQMAGRGPDGMEQSPPDTYRHVHEMRGRKDCTQGYEEPQRGCADGMEGGGIDVVVDFGLVNVVGGNHDIARCT